MASKSGSFFRKFFKLIFSLAGLLVAALAVILMVLPFTGTEVIVPVVGEISLGVSGFAWAFGGDPTIFLNDELVDFSEVKSALESLQLPIDTTVEMNAGITATFVLLAVAALLALVYVVFCWGHRNAKVKKGIGAISALLLLVGGILCFLACTFTEWPVESSEEFLIEYTSGLGVGAIFSGVAGILGAILMGVATLFGPKEK